MVFKINFALLFLSLFSFLSFNINAEEKNGRVELNMNTDWAFYRGDCKEGEKLKTDDSQWIPAVLPHIMQLEKKHCGEDGIYDGIGWYRRYFTLPDQYKGKRIVISFEGVMNACKIFINEKEVSEHHGGYMGFTVDISKNIEWGKNNLLSVRVSAEYDSLTPPGKPQGKLDFYYYSGIYRDVNMIITDRLHITDALEENEVAGGGIFVTYPKVNKEEALVHVKTHLNNGYADKRKMKLQTVLKDQNGKVVGKQESSVTLEGNHKQSIEQTIQVKKPLLWHPYTPHLYTLESRVIADNKVVDVCTNDIGIRTIRYDIDEGFFINGEKLYLRGANRHQSFPYIGDAASNSMQARDVIDMKRGGYNAVRAAHYPQDPAFLSACDKYGLLVVECIPGWQYFNRDSIFVSRMYEAGRTMIRRDRNHPSVILWETALNETHYPKDIAGQIAKSLYQIAHAEYPGDQMYTAGDYFGYEDVLGNYDVFYKQVGKFPKDGNVMSNYPDDLIRLSALFTREWGDGVGKKPRVSLTENEEELVKQCETRYDHLEGRGYFDWCMLDANERSGGHFLWSYNDYNRGCCENTMYSGAVDVNRYPKFCYYMLQSMRDKAISQDGLYSGPTVFVASYNSSADFRTSSRGIMVFSNCDEVRLYRNDRLVGAQTRKERSLIRPHIVKKGGSPDFVFEVNGYEAGELRAEGLINGKIVATHSVRTPEKPHHLKVIVHDDNIQPVADGSDMVPVYIKVCDKNGTLVNNSLAMIHLTMDGDGCIVGEGIDRLGITDQQVEGGIGFAFIRTTKQAGKISIKAELEGLEAGEAIITSVKYAGEYLPDGYHIPYQGNEEDGVKVKLNVRERDLLTLPVLNPDKVTVTNEQKAYPVSNVMDGDDGTWWIAETEATPQAVTFSFNQPVNIYASRILFQKDSSLYGHTVEVSEDGQKWDVVYEAECTGWDFKPREINKKNISYFRITIHSVSGGNAGIGEVVLFGKNVDN